jgi:serine/threonine-protein kinase
MSETTPQRIGDYEIIRELGHGGMGKVYLARNVLSDRIEAMKVILPDLAGRSEFVARFMREIKTLAGLDHPNIAALRTAFTAGDQFVMIMEYVEGVSLADRLEQGRIPIADALNYTQQVLSALSYAHARHVIHRDIKPGNMMLTPQGVVKLMDFGLARSADEVGLTVTGATLGSLDYASPEQVQSLPTDERSDLYSVGVSLYQMVTHQRMFSVTSSFAIMQAQVKEMPRPPAEIVPSLPKGLNDVIMKSIAKNPAERFQSADEFHQALAQISSDAQESQSVAAATPTIAVPSMVPPRGDPGFTVQPSRNSSSPMNRSLLLIVGVVLVAALVAGDAVYKSHQQKLRDQPDTATTATTTATTATAPAPAATASATTAPTPDTSSTPTPPPPAATEPTQAAPPATASPQAHSKRATADNLPPEPRPSTADIQAQQQAALEQKHLLDTMETELDQLHGRAATVDSSLGALEQQMHNSGLGLRGDMVAARSNMHNDLDKATQALNSGDTDRAQHFIDLAHREMEKLEAFLGHR